MFTRIHHLAFSFLLVMMLPLSTMAQAKKTFSYGGVATCKACHMTKKSGAQYKIWQDGPHAKAFETLKSEKAKTIGAKMGIEDPSTSEKCVKCHVTAYGVDEARKGPKLTMEEGIGCESCHGPGSEYKKRAIITGIYEGKLKAEDYGLIKPVTEKVCVECHNEESPTYTKFVFAERAAKIAHPVPEK